MDDLISRQAVLDAINSGMLTDDDTQFECPSECNSMLEWAVNAVKELPTAEKKGKWKGYNPEKEEWKRSDGSPVFMSCSECYCTVLNNGSAHWNYCPNCGARMEESE